ncbi:MAG: hypothetical protein AB7G88_13045, partial [Thermomicrobiales bacterium]
MQDNTVPQSLPAIAVSRRLSRTTVFALSVAGTTLFGLVLRLVMLKDVIGHIDEPASLLAVKRVAELGYPGYPSGLLYLQGAFFSYVAAPLTWFFDDSELLTAARLLYLGIAISVIPLSMMLVHGVTESFSLALFAGILVACDPNLIFWGVTIRPYGMITSCVVALVFLFVLLVREGPGARLPLGSVVSWIPVLVAVGTFTHIGFLLAYPPIAISAISIWKGALRSTHRPILVSGVLSLLPPLAFYVLGRSNGGGGTGEGALGGSIIGGHLFGIFKSNGSPDLRWSLWTDNFSEGVLFAVIPSVIALASGVLIYALLSPHHFTNRWSEQTVGVVVFVHWFVILAVTLLVVSDFEPRYLTQVLPLGYILLSFAVWSLWDLAKVHSAMTARLMRMGVVLLLVLPALIQTSTATNWRL